MMHKENIAPSGAVETKCATCGWYFWHSKGEQHSRCMTCLHGSIQLLKKGCN